MRSSAIVVAVSLLFVALAGGTAVGAFTATAQTPFSLTAAQSFYAAEVASDAPVLHWRLGEGVGVSTAADETGRWPGTYSGTVSHNVAGRSRDGNTAISLAGAGGVSTTSSAVDFAGRVPFSLEAWTYVADTSTGDYGRLFTSEGLSGLGRQGYLVYRCPAAWSSAGTTCFFVERYADGVGSAAGTGELSLGNWHHLAFTYDGTTLRAYADGQLGGTGTSAYAMNARNVGLVIGAGGNPYTGRIDEVAVYDTALSAARVAVHWGRGGGP